MKSPKQRPTVLMSAVAVSSCLVLGACGGGTEAQGDMASEGPGPSMEELYNAAKEAGEKEVVVYGVEDDTCYDEFSRAFPGISVRSQYMVGETQARLQQEYVSGKQVGDVLRTGSTSFLALSQDDIMAPFTPATSEDLPDDLFGPENRFIATTKRASGLAYNNEQLSEAEAPSSWDDLTDPKLKGQVVMPDPTGPGAGLSILQELLQTGGTTDEEWLEKLAANDPAFIEGVQPAIESLKTGEFPVMFGGLDQVTGLSLEQGSPITYVFPVEGATPVTQHFTGVIRGAPHPNAARLLETWLLSKEGQTCLVEKGNEYPVRTEGVPSPEGVPPLSELFDVTPPRDVNYQELDRQAQYLTQFKEVFAGG